MLVSLSHFYRLLPFCQINQLQNCYLILWIISQRVLVSSLLYFYLKLDSTVEIFLHIFTKCACLLYVPKCPFPLDMGLRLLIPLSKCEMSRFTVRYMVPLIWSKFVASVDVTLSLTAIRSRLRTLLIQCFRN